MAGKIYSLDEEEKMFLYKKLIRANKENGCFDEFKSDAFTSTFKNFIEWFKIEEGATPNSGIDVHNLIINSIWQKLRQHMLGKMYDDCRLSIYCSFGVLRFTESLRGSKSNKFDDIADTIDVEELSYIAHWFNGGLDAVQCDRVLKELGIDMVSVFKEKINKKWLTNNTLKVLNDVITTIETNHRHEEDYRINC